MQNSTKSSAILEEFLKKFWNMRETIL